MSLPAVGETAGTAGCCCPPPGIQINFAYPGPANPLPLGFGGTGAALSAPGEDSIMFYDLSALGVGWLTLGAGLSFVGTVLTLTGTQADNLAFLRTDGGTSTDLDALVTVGKQDGTVRWVITSSSDASLWELVTDTQPIDWSNGVGRPLDYGAGNTRNWIRQL